MPILQVIFQDFLLVFLLPAWSKGLVIGKSFDFAGLVSKAITVD